MLYNIVFTKYPFKRVFGYVTAFHRIIMLYQCCLTLVLLAVVVTLELEGAKLPLYNVGSVHRNS